MPVNIFPTVAENVIGAVDAVVTYGTSCDANFLSQLLDIDVAAASDAMDMAVQIGLLTKTSASYSGSHPFSSYLVTSDETQRCAVLRILLEDYPPYALFKQRLSDTNDATRAANNVRVTFSLSRTREQIKGTLVDLGTFSKSLIQEGGGRLSIDKLEKSNASYISALLAVAQNRADAELAVVERLGEVAVRWIDRNEILNPLITGFQLLAEGGDTKAPILHVGNAIESFLAQMGTVHNVPLTTATGINAKVDALKTAGHLLKKHTFMLKYLGHVRNAADHGTDPATGRTWGITKETSVQYVHVAFATIRTIILASSNQFEL